METSTVIIADFRLIYHQLPCTRTQTSCVESDGLISS